MRWRVKPLICFWLNYVVSCLVLGILRMLCLVLINSVLLNLSRVWILF